MSQTPSQESSHSEGQQQRGSPARQAPQANGEDMTVMAVAMKQTSQVEAPNIHSDSGESPEDRRCALGHTLSKLLTVLVSLGVMAIGGIAVAL